ncbi:DEAD/DEAH box helicase [Candidatus Woesearchaeota archaeon]|nr:DEAD/DEAH box helicase [Candidatus Woesearchaeota archaeon]
MKAIKDQQFVSPSDIQQKSIPLILSGKDVIAGSATGSGKTLAFGAGIIQNSERGRGIQALILTPTRELAEQIHKELIKFSKYKPLQVAVVYGGVAIDPQMSKLRTADVVVGTPGRILDHMSRGTVNFSKVRILVLDEADRMLDMGFIDDVERIIKVCPKERQTLLFSATIPPDLASLSKRYMHDAVKVSVDSYVDPKKLKQVYYDVEDNMKFSLLVHLLRNEQAGLAMIFCNTQRNTDFVARNLKLSGISALAIHGGFTQAKRTRTMDDFHNKSFKVLVCTDVAARGLDIKGVTHVYNYDIPKESKQYIHRIGRTARAGKDGIAINILSPRDHDNMSRVFKDYDLQIEKMERPFIDKIRVKIDQPRTGFREGRSGFRGNQGRGRGPAPRQGQQGRQGRGQQQGRQGERFGPRRNPAQSRQRRF